MDHEELRHWSKRAADWAADYHAALRDRPVTPPMQPGDLARRLPACAPEAPEPMAAIWADFEALVPGAMTHWQHPRFFGYFPANAAPASMLAEQLANAMAAQGMLWQTAPAAAEMEGVVTGWLRAALGLPEAWRGTIHDSATTATLAAVLTMRERALAGEGNAQGLAGGPVLRVYASGECHSSVDKAMRVAGLGQANLVKVPVRADLSMDAGALTRAIAADRAAGLRPAGVIGCIGGTSVGASDRLTEILAVARAEGLYSHVDAAWAGSAMICSEFRPLWQGVEAADSLVFNPHKWLGAQFDCSVQFLADPGPQVAALALRPDYLKTVEDGAAANYSEWTLPLGRRFRALKLWFLLRAEGLEGLRAMIRNHVAWAAEAEARLAALPGVEISSPRTLSLFTFRLAAGDDATEALMARINATGAAFLSGTRHAGRFVIRMQVGPWSTTRDDVLALPALVARLL